VPNEPHPVLTSAIRHYNRWDYLLYGEILRKFPRPTVSSSRDAGLP
jgi:hypothetical protein